MIPWTWNMFDGSLCGQFFLTLIEHKKTTKHSCLQPKCPWTELNGNEGCSVSIYRRTECSIWLFSSCLYCSDGVVTVLQSSSSDWWCLSIFLCSVSFCASDKESGERLSRLVEEACMLLADYSGRLAAEIDDRRQLTRTLTVFLQSQKDGLAQNEQKLEVRK